ncbi:MAG TPA: response regulator [Planctomycetaceae bacterium]|nr:response regulator [Planctomycetaceae bacterium]
MKILVVDDSKMVRVILKRWLVQLRFPEADVIEAANGELALKTFEKFPIDAVITDWSMPVMDGLTLVKEIRKRCQQIPIIMITSEGDRERVTTAIQSGVNDYLVKPFTAGTLRDKLSLLLKTLAARSDSAASAPERAPAPQASAQESPPEKVDA